MFGKGSSIFSTGGSIFGSASDGKTSLTSQREEFLQTKARDEREELLRKSAQRLEHLVTQGGQMLLQAEAELADEPDEMVHMMKNMDIELEDEEPSPVRAPKAKTGESTYQIHQYLQTSSRLESTETLDDLHTEWLIAAKPAGSRVLAIVGNGITELAFKNGKCRRMHSNLLGGSIKSSVPGVTQFLDCILTPNDTLYVLDAIMIDKKYLHEHPFEVRQFFLRSKIQELNETSSNSNSSNTISLKTLCYVTASKDNIGTVYNDLPEAERDGLLLIEKNSPYYLGEENMDCIWLRPEVNPTDPNSTIGSLTLRFSLFDKTFQTKDAGFKLRCPPEKIGSGDQPSSNFSDSCFWKGSHGGSLRLIDGKSYRIGIREISGVPALFCRDITSFTVFGYTHYDPMPTGTVKGKLDMIVNTMTADQFVTRYSRSQLMEE